MFDDGPARMNVRKGSTLQLAIQLTEVPIVILITKRQCAHAIKHRIARSHVVFQVTIFQIDASFADRNIRSANTPGWGLASSTFRGPLGGIIVLSIHRSAIGNFLRLTLLDLLNLCLLLKHSRLSGEEFFDSKQSIL